MRKSEVLPLCGADLHRMPRPAFLADLIFVSSLAGKTEEARALTKGLEASPKGDATPVDLAMAYAAVGEGSRAIGRLTESADAHSSQLIGNIKTFYFYSLRNDSRFEDLPKKVGLSQ